MFDGGSEVAESFRFAFRLDMKEDGKGEKIRNSNDRELNPSTDRV
jgi:hypothetical protein